MYTLIFPSETLRTNNAQSLKGSNATLHARNPCVARVVRHLLVLPLLFGGRRPDFNVKGLHDGDGNDNLYGSAHRVTYYTIRSSNLQRDVRSASLMYNTDFIFLPFFLLDEKYLYSMIADTSTTYDCFRFFSDCPDHDPIFVLQ